MIRLSLVLLAALLAGGAAAAAGVGETLPALDLKDARGNDATLGDSVRRIYASADRQGDALLRDALAGPGQAALDAQGAVVIADISDAPGFIKGLIRSRLKDRKYATWLDLTGKTRALLPYRSDAVAVVDLDRRRIIAIRHAASLEELRRELASAPPAAPPAAPPDPR